MGDLFKAIGLTSIASGARNEIDGGLSGKYCEEYNDGVKRYGLEFNEGLWDRVLL